MDIQVNWEFSRSQICPQVKWMIWKCLVSLKSRLYSFYLFLQCHLPSSLSCFAPWSVTCRCSFDGLPCPLVSIGGTEEARSGHLFLSIPHPARLLRADCVSWPKVSAPVRWPSLRGFCFGRPRCSKGGLSAPSSGCCMALWFCHVPPWFMAEAGIKSFELLLN